MIVDIIIVLLLISGFITGYKRGFIKQAISTIGLIVIVVLAFLLKNNLSIILYKKCPFFTIGLLKNYSSLNILVYELISFFILFFIFSIILKIIIKIIGKVEDILEDSSVLKIPLKIFGGVLGTIEVYVSLFIILLFLSLPIFGISNFIYESKLKDNILNNTFLISNISKPLVKSIDQIKELEIQKNIGKKEFNCETIEIFKKNNIISEKSIKYLKDHNKLNIDCE